MEFPAFFAVPPEILCPKYTPVAPICQYVLHIFVILFKFRYANICKMTKIQRIAPPSIAEKGKGRPIILSVRRAYVPEIVKGIPKLVKEIAVEFFRRRVYNENVITYIIFKRRG